jgi:hypothetical protein
VRDEPGHRVIGFVNGRHAATLMFDDEQQARAFFQKCLVAERAAPRKPEHIVRVERWDEHGMAEEWITDG